MSLNCDKCKILRVYRLRNPIIHHYTMNGTPLDSVSHHPYLGVELSSNLNWSFHIENIIGKALPVPWFPSDVIFIPVQKVLKVRPTLYLTIVRPILEYTCSVWDPHTQKHCHDIDGAQRRAARFVKSCYMWEPGTVTNLLNDLNWHSSELRRKIARLTTM